MTIYGWLISAFWLALVAYWASSAGAVKRGIGGRWMWWREIAVRLGFFALVVSTVQVALLGHVVPNVRPYVLSASVSMGLIGVLCCVLGIGLAILGRAYLERTSGVELVTDGPYALVRHPIYGGMLLAMLGSALGQSMLWLLPLIVYGPFFIRSARREEKLLSEQFPERYPAYQQRTKMLLPFVL